MLEALLRHPAIEVWTYGPFTNTWMPWSGVSNIDSKYVFTPDFPMVYDPPVPAINYGLVEKNKPWEPDLWLEVNAGIITHGRPAQGPYVIIGSDPHVLRLIYDQVRPKADYFFGMQGPYLGPDDIWLPYGFDPVWHAPSKIPMAERKYDAALLGLQYEKRNRLMQSLETAGMKIVYQLGLVYDQARDVYHDTRVGLNWSSLQDTTARCFELMAMGCVPVLNRVPDLMHLFKEGEHFLGFDSIDEARDQVRLMVNDPTEAEAMTRKAKMAVAEHSWDNRMKQVLKHVGVVK